MAELFTPSLKIDINFAKKLNINGMVREIQNRQDTPGVGAYFHQLTCQEAVLGRIDLATEDVTPEGSAAKFYKRLTPQKPRDVIYDCTHDNPSPLDKFGTRRLALPQIGLLSMANIIIATTWGFDQLFARNFSVVTEDRLYPIEELSKWPRPLDPISLEPCEECEPCFEFCYHAPDAANVAIAASFNNWQPNLLLERSDNGNWKKSVQISWSGQMQYKFVLNGKEWQIDKNKPTIKDKNGHINNCSSNAPVIPSFYGHHE